MELMYWILLAIATGGVLLYHRASLLVSTVSFGVLFLIQSLLGHEGGGAIQWALFIILALLLNVLPVRRALLSKGLLRVFKKVMPAMSKTESEALTSGTVGWEGECFQGMPDWAALKSIPAPHLSSEEQAFLDGPVEILCGMLKPWEINHQLCNLPEHVWRFLKEERFFSMIIGKEHGGLAFSAYAQSQVIIKVAAVSVTAGTIISVPNSLGPGELISHYGTEEQKSYYLPRLVNGEEIPCFALTSPQAGSDAAAMQDYGVICRESFEGEETLGLRLNWDKRYITLAPVATLLGLAFKCYDPDGLLGEDKELGITCALIPTNTPGVTTGRRHFPLNSAFPNGPTQGQDVFIPLDWVIGGRERIGHGWKMLMECLAAGRAVSLPSMVTGGARMAAMATGVYTRARRQFNTAIANFEGVEEAIARIAGYTYMMDATRQLTLSVLDAGERPAVASAISKYHVTELARSVMNDAMDIHGGKGICLGPNNYLGRGYQEGPVSITVEGANILTRSLIIFGQGAVRCHPFVLDEINAAKLDDRDEAVKIFDKVVFGHIGYVLSNVVRSIVLSITGGFFADAPKNSGRTKKYYKQLSRFSAGFAHMADVAMTSLGGNLKRRERTSARLGDMLSYLYMGSAVLKYFENNGSKSAELPAVEWAMAEVISRLQAAIVDFTDNFPIKWLGRFMRAWVMPWGTAIKKPTDRQGHALAALITNPSLLRDRFGADLYLTPNPGNVLGNMHHHLERIIAVESLEKKLASARRKGLADGHDYAAMVATAVGNEVLSQRDAELLIEVNDIRHDICAVDDFDPSELTIGMPADFVLNNDVDVLLGQ